MNTCLFCRIASGEIPAEKVYEDETTIIIRDINPQAPFHLLAIPKQHFNAVHDIHASEMSELMGSLMNAISQTLRKIGLDQKGYRMVINSGEIAGQSVPHLHVHLLGGRSMQWPPG